MITAEKIKSDCSALTQFLIAKNNKYGNSALKPIGISSKESATKQILARMDLRLARVRQRGWTPDAIADMKGYLVLYIASLFITVDGEPSKAITQVLENCSNTLCQQLEKHGDTISEIPTIFSDLEPIDILYIRIDDRIKRMSQIILSDSKDNERPWEDLLGDLVLLTILNMEDSKVGYVSDVLSEGNKSDLVTNVLADIKQRN